MLGGRWDGTMYFGTMTPHHSLCTDLDECPLWVGHSLSKSAWVPNLSHFSLHLQCWNCQWRVCKGCQLHAWTGFVPFHNGCMQHTLTEHTHTRRHRERASHFVNSALCVFASLQTVGMMERCPWQPAVCWVCHSLVNEKPVGLGVLGIAFVFEVVSSPSRPVQSLYPFQVIGSVYQELLANTATTHAVVFGQGCFMQATKRKTVWNVKLVKTWIKELLKFRPWMKTSPLKASTHGTLPHHHHTLTPFWWDSGSW